LDRRNRNNEEVISDSEDDGYGDELYGEGGEDEIEGFDEDE